MSKDLRLAWDCPHLTVEEHVFLGSDRRSLPTRQPVAGSGQLRILVNGEFYVPQGGLHMPAQVSSSVSGPFTLVEGEDTLVIETSRGTETIHFGVAGSIRMSTQEVLTEMHRRRVGLVVLEDVNGHLHFTDAHTVGVQSYVRVRGTAAYRLGFGSPGLSDRQSGSVGRQVYPAWGLHVREDSITNRYPRFVEPIRTNPVFNVTYSVPPQRCLRCGAGYVENDYRFDSHGQAITIQNENLLYQASLKLLLTDRGSNPYHTWYGTTIRSRIGTKAVAGLSAVLSEDIRRALAQMQKVQQEQARYQSVTFREQLYAVQQVTVLPHREHPSVYLVGVTVQNASGEPVVLDDIVYTAPEVVSFLDSGSQILGRQTAGLDAVQARTLFLDGP